MAGDKIIRKEEVIETGKRHLFDSGKYSAEEKAAVRIYDFLKQQIELSKIELEKLNEKVEKTKSQASKTVDDLIREAEAKAKIIIAKAEEEKEQILSSIEEDRQKAFEDARQKGIEEGKNQGYEESKNEINEKYKDFFVFLKQAHESTLIEKKEYLKENIELVASILEILLEKTVMQYVKINKDIVKTNLIGILEKVDIPYRTIIYLNEEDYERLYKIQEEILGEFLIDRKIDLKKSKAVEEGGVIVDLGYEQIDSNIKIRIKQAIETLIKNKDFEKVFYKLDDNDR